MLIIYNKKAFTLVELIIVITILAILGTIGFITFQGYSKNSRDSVRVSDINRIKSGLELYIIDSGKYPEPTESKPVTYSGGLAWTQGIFGEATFTNVKRLDKIPKDPLTGKEYVYSLLNTKKKYEIGGIRETEEVGISNSNYIEGKTSNALVMGTYNGIAMRVNTNGTSYVLSIPSIITSIDLEEEENRKLETIIPNKELVLDGYRNLPSNYVDTNYKTNPEKDNANYEIVKDNDINNALIYEGNIEDLTTEYLITKIIESYSGTTVEQLGNAEQFLEVDVTDEEELEKADITGVHFINNELGGSAETKIYDSCKANASYNSGTTQTYNVTALNHNDTETFTRDVTENNGTFSYSIDVSCYNGLLTNSEEVGPIINNCEEGYYLNGNSCESQWSGDGTTTGFKFNNTSGVAQYPTSCSDLLNQNTWKNTLIGSPWNGSKFEDGVYYIKPDSNKAFKVYCDMTTDGGGWTLVMNVTRNHNETFSSNYSNYIEVNSDTIEVPTYINSGNILNKASKVNYTEIAALSIDGGNYNSNCSWDITNNPNLKLNQCNWSIKTDNKTFLGLKSDENDCYIANQSLGGNIKNYASFGPSATNNAIHTNWSSFGIISDGLTINITEFYASKFIYIAEYNNEYKYYNGENCTNGLRNNFNTCVIGIR